MLFLCAILLFGIISCAGSEDPVSQGSDLLNNGIETSLTIPDDTDPDRQLLGYWYWNLKSQTSSPAFLRTSSDHMNIFGLFLLPDYSGSLQVEFDNPAPQDPFAPPAIGIKTTLTNNFGVTGWNVRGILIDNSGLILLADPDGFTVQWDDGGDIPLNPYLNFIIEDGSLPIGETIDRTYTIESPTGVLPDGLWFAIDAGMEGKIKSAVEFPVAAVNGAFRWPGDQAPILCRINDPESFVECIVAASDIFSGGVMFLDEQDPVGGYREWTGTLDYDGSLGGGYYPLYFAAWSPSDIPTLAVAHVRVDPGPFATGPADTGCSQRCYDPARTCRTTSQIVIPLNNFIVRPPASTSGLILGENNKVIRRIEDYRSIACQTPGMDVPEWTKLIGESSLATIPAIGDDGTIFFLEPEQGRLRALYPDGSERWVHNYGYPTHTDLILTSSPIGGLLITILRNNGSDIAIVAVGTDGHLRWKYDLLNEPTGSDAEPRLAVGPGGTLYYTIPTGGAFAFDLLGNPKWAVNQAGWTSSSDPVAGDDDSLFLIVNGGRRVACLNPDGSEKWEYPLESGSLANFPSLSYGNDLFVIIEQEDENVEVRSLDGELGSVSMTVEAPLARGYVVHGTHHDFVLILGEHPDPPPIPPGVDDFFVCYNGNGDLNWLLHTPGFTQDGAYPIVSSNNTIYVQGPDGMYVVMY